MGNSVSSWSAPEAHKLPISFVDFNDEAPHALELQRYIAIFFLALGILLVITKTKTWLKASRSRAHHTYEKPLWYPHKDPILGLDTLLNLARAVNNHRFLEFTAELISRFGGTVTYLSLGQEAVYTIDPANLHTMLADRTSFHDFGHGPTRRKDFQPLFGNGIFNSDGALWKVRLKPVSCKWGGSNAPGRPSSTIAGHCDPFCLM